MIANVAQRMLAPGAEEFLPAATVGPWLPPERTFTPLEGENFRVERARFFDVGVEHEFAGAYVLGVRRFQQRVDNQMATLFGLPVSGGPASPGHYAVANAGGARRGRMGRPAAQRAVAAHPRLRSTTASRAREWVSRGDMAAIAVWAPSAIRPRNEDIHDLTTSIETDVPHTATRVFLLYKINNAFARGGDPDAHRRRLSLRRAGEPGAPVHAVLERRPMGSARRACGTCSAIPPTPAPSTTSSSSSARRSASSAACSFDSELSAVKARLPKLLHLIGYLLRTIGIVTIPTV